MGPNGSDDVAVVHVPGRSCFEAYAGRRHAATLEYRISGPAAVLAYSHAPDGDLAALAVLIDAALESLVGSGHYAVALCPHVRAFLRERPHRRAGVDARFVDPTPSGTVPVIIGARAG